MFKRFISSLIIFSMLWIDVAKAMDEEEKDTPHLTSGLPSRSPSPPPPFASSPPDINGTGDTPLSNKTTLEEDTTQEEPLSDFTSPKSSPESDTKSGGFSLQFASPNSSPESNTKNDSFPLIQKKPVIGTVAVREGSKEESDALFHPLSESRSTLETHAEGGIDSTSPLKRSSLGERDSKQRESHESPKFSLAHKDPVSVSSLENHADSQLEREDVSEKSSLLSKDKKKDYSTTNGASHVHSINGDDNGERSSSSDEEDVEKGRRLQEVGPEGFFLIPQSIPSKKKALLSFAPPLSEESSDEQPSDIDLHSLLLDEESRLLHKAQALFEEKIKGTSLEHFGRWYQGYVVKNGYRWQDPGGLVVAGGMAVGTGLAMSPIVEWSLNNKYLSFKQNNNYDMPIAYYINGSTSLIAFTDAASLMTDATSPSTRAFTVRKSAQEKRADWILIPLAAIPGLYLLLLGFEIQQEHKKATNTTGWWNEFDQYLYFTSLGFFPYLVIQTWVGMRAAVSKWFHPTIPEHVREDVMALRQLEARLDHLPDDEIEELYTFFTSSHFTKTAASLVPKLKSWWAYFSKGELSDTAKVEGILNYLCLTKYAKDKWQEEGEESQQPYAKKSLAAKIMSGLGTPAGFGVIAISLFGLFEAFMGPIPALCLSLTGASLGFLPGAFMQKHNLDDALDTIREGIIPYLKGKGSALKDTLKDPYAWGRGLGRAWAFLQNTLTNIAPILVSLTILIPETLGGSDTIQKVMTGVMLGVALPYIITEMFTGTIDISNHVMKIAHFIQDVYHNIKSFVAKQCCSYFSSKSPDYQRRWLKKRIQRSIATTIRFTPDHKRRLDDLQLRLSFGGGNGL